MGIGLIGVLRDGLLSHDCDCERHCDGLVFWADTCVVSGWVGFVSNV